MAVINGLQKKGSYSMLRKNTQLNSVVNRFQKKRFRKTLQLSGKQRQTKIQ
jgi:hypothetical protein